MRSKLLKMRGAAAPIVNKPSGVMSDEEIDALLFCTEEEEDAAIQAILEDDPEGDKDIPLEQANAELDRALAAWEAEDLRNLRNK